MLTPRTYQRVAYEEAISYMRSTKEPGLIKIGTGGGKSVVVALLALHVKKHGKGIRKVLCLAPNADLVRQNSAKYLATGERCSIFCASLGKKDTGHDVVFASPLSVVKNLDRFKEPYALIVSDESQGVSEEEDSSYQLIFAHFRAINPALRIVGLTATDSRYKTKLVSEKTTFKKHIYKYEHRHLSRDGWVVPYVFGKNHAEYDSSNVKQKSNGKFDQTTVDAATLGHERLTRAIIADLDATMKQQGRKCCMIFAASIKHAKEIVSYIRPGQAALVTGETGDKLREKTLDEARAGKWRFLVTVSALAVGTDVPICDTIAILRFTESGGFYIQIVGRGCRLYDPNWREAWGQMNWTDDRYNGKDDCLVMDYAQNIERFKMDDDLTLTGLVELKSREEMNMDGFEVDCPDCGHSNRPTAVRCTGITAQDERCQYRFIYKTCDKCETKNSPTARYCRHCDAELIDPNDKLQLKAAIAAGKPFYVAVHGMQVSQHMKGDEMMLRVNYNTVADGVVYHVAEYLKPADPNPYQVRRFKSFAAVTGAKGRDVVDILMNQGILQPPGTLIIKRKPGSKFYEVIDRKPAIDRNNQLAQPTEEKAQYA